VARPRFCGSDEGLRRPWENGLRVAEIAIETMARDQMTIP
jgi:hypothetical protein